MAPCADLLAGRSADRDEAHFAGGVWAVVEVDVSRYLGRAEKINITLPSRLLARIDAYARAHGETRSGFLARAAQAAMNERQRA